LTYRLLVLDLDGTVMDRDFNISQAVIDAVKTAREHGVLVTIATGRTFSSTLQFVPSIGGSEPLICYQGALIADPQTGNVLYQAGLSGQLAERAVAHLLARGIVPLAFCDGKTVVDRWSPELDLYLGFHPGGESDVLVVPDLVRYARDVEPIKLLFAAHPDELDAIVARLRLEFGNSASVVRSHPQLGEITAPGVDKGSAIEELARMLNVERDEVIAIGDEENDIPMIEWAGLGLAMANAPASVLAVADATIPPIGEDGVAVAIDRYLLDGIVR
jgi:Cof subfamily protein (haloacid dehalogenase superfamily)